MVWNTNGDILTEALSLVLKTRVESTDISGRQLLHPFFALVTAAFFPEGPLKWPQFVSLVTNYKNWLERKIKVTQTNVFKLFKKKHVSCYKMISEENLQRQRATYTCTRLWAGSASG